MTENHELWDELLAGQALHSLDHDDEVLLHRHAADCDVCRDELADFEAVAADLARALPALSPPAGGKEGLRAALASSTERPPGAATLALQRSPAGSTRPRSRSDARRPAGAKARRLSRSLVAATTAVVLLAAGAIGYGLRQRHLASDRGSKLAAAEQLLRGIAAGHRTIGMRSEAAGLLARGQVVQSDGHVWLVADGLTSNDRSASTYVLWASTPQGGMAAVATFDVGKDGIAVVNGATLPHAAADVPGFAISQERGRTAPPRPSTPLLRSQA